MLGFMYIKVDHPRCTVDGMSFVTKFWTDLMYGFGDISIFRFFYILVIWLEYAYSRPFWAVLL